MATWVDAGNLGTEDEADAVEVPDVGGGWAMLLAVVEDRRPDWHQDALCREYPASWWFPERGEPVDCAKDVCSRCLCRRVLAAFGAGGLSYEAERNRLAHHYLEVGQTTAPRQSRQAVTWDTVVDLEEMRDPELKNFAIVYEAKAPLSRSNHSLASMHVCLLAQPLR